MGCPKRAASAPRRTAGAFEGGFLLMQPIDGLTSRLTARWGFLREAI